MSVIDNLIATDSIKLGSNSAALLYARLEKLNKLSWNLKKEYSQNLLNTYPEGNPMHQLIVICTYNRLFNDNEEDLENLRKKYNFLKRAIASDPDTGYAGCLEGICQKLIRKNLAIEVAEQVIPHQPFTIRLVNLNVPDCYLNLVKIANYNYGYKAKTKFMPADSKTAFSYHFSSDNELPFFTDVTIDIPGLEGGYYAIVPSSTPDFSGAYPDFSSEELPVINVCDFVILTTSSTASGSPENITNIYVSDAATGAPVEGATVYTQALSTKSDYSTFPIKKSVTDREGRSQCSDGRFLCEIRNGASRMFKILKSMDRRQDHPAKYSASVMTDLALYHPGDSIQLVVVVGHSQANLLEAADGINVKIQLWNPNDIVVESISAITDQFGRVTTTFNIPNDGLTGMYTVRAAIETDDEPKKIYNEYVGSARVQVAEYKAPTFRLSLDTPILDKDTVEITGCAVTFAGLPLSDIKVDINIHFNHVWWRWNRYDVPTAFHTTIKTDSNGRFRLLLGLEKMSLNEYSTGYFTLDASATSDSGETESASTNFNIFTGYNINLRDQKIEASGSEISISVPVSNLLGEKVVKQLSYILADDYGIPVSSGAFLSPNLKLPASSIPSGKYRLTVKPLFTTDSSLDLREKWEEDSVSCNIVVWRDTDIRPPYETALWLPVKSLFSTPNSNFTDISVGSSYPDSEIFYQIADCQNIIEEGWINASGSNVHLRVPSPKIGNRVKVNLMGIHDLDVRVASVTVIPAEEKITPKIYTSTFHDRITPDAHEKWTFRIVREETPLGNTPVMAVLSNAMLNSITPFQWNMNIDRILSYNIRGGINNQYCGTSRFYGRFKSNYISKGDCGTILYPAWNFWEKGLYSPYGFFNGALDDLVVTAYGVASKSQLTGSAAVIDNYAVKIRGVDGAEFTDEEFEFESYDYALSEESESISSHLMEEDIDLRDTECPLAFFKPLLLTDTDGYVDISFDVPNFNTTWALQLLTYDERMRSGYYSAEIVAARPVIVTTNMPRFLLTGDRASVAATMFNNTEESISANGRIEIFNPATGDVLAFSETGSVALAPSANSTWSVEFPVPADCNVLGIRSTVRSAEGSDGEQQLIQVLPSSQPVMEATTFYLTPGDRDISVTLPKMGDEDVVTLNYCANPAWFVLTSLSGVINPDSESTLANLNSFYANCVAGGLISRYPNLREGLLEMTHDAGENSPLVSGLQKREDLKISTLINTPWVNNASSETDRMQCIVSLTDSLKLSGVIGDGIRTLLKNQKPDGGFSWMPQMEESVWITLNVINCAARIKETGFGPSEAAYEDMLKRALGYADKGVGKDYYETVYVHHGTYPLTSEISYLLDRSIISAAPLEGYVAMMHADMMKRLPKEWRGLSIQYAALAARILHREGKDQLAREIMESVKQFASYKPDKGMWFDTLRDSFFSPSPKLVTASVIMALNEILPGDPDILKMCQYLVLSRQTEDWNLDMSPAAVTATSNAVLASDLGWNDPGLDTAPVITLDGKPLDLPAGNAMVGEIWLDLTPEQASGGLLEVRRSAAVPAWGGVLRQFVQPAADVKEHSIPQLKVTKSMLTIVSEKDGVRAVADSHRFRKGDLIRITLTLETDRDLDYLLINDRRGAFMQPVDQLTQYKYENGLWILRESRNTATNFYLTTLPKGEYIITYDVRADRDGEYSTGITTAQSQYYPLITAHSAGVLVTVE